MSTKTLAEAQAAENATKNLAQIIRGRMPVALVFVIRFADHGEDVKDAALAKMYGTTPGKISDIKKCQNFKYVDEAWKPSADDIEAGKAWAAQMREAEWADEHTKEFAEAIDEKLDALELASEEELAKQEESRKGSRKPRNSTKADAGETKESATEGNDESGDDAGDVDVDLGDLVS